MSKILIPEVISNGQMETLPALRSGGLLARWFGGESNALTRIERQRELEISKIQAKAETIRYEMHEAAGIEVLTYQLQKSVDISKHKIDLEARNQKILATLGKDFELDTRVEEFRAAIEEMGLDPLEEIQHRMKARKTARREKARHRMHHHHRH